MKNVVTVNDLMFKVEWDGFKFSKHYVICIYKCCKVNGMKRMVQIEVKYK